MDAHEKIERRNRFFFWVAAGASFWLMVAFTIAFFRGEEGNARFLDVDPFWVIGVIGIIAGYAGHNRGVMHKKCPDAGPLPGEWIVAGIVVWTGALLLLYQLKVTASLWDVEMVVPELFYHFILTVLGIFGLFNIPEIKHLFPPYPKPGRRKKEEG